MVTAVIEEILGAIADAEGTEPRDLDIALHNWVSTDAIAHLEAHDSAAWKLVFEIPDHVVTVTGDETILVDGTEERTLS